MEPGLKRTIIARIAAGFGCLSGAIGLLVAIANDRTDGVSVESCFCCLPCSCWSTEWCRLRNFDLGLVLVAPTSD